MVHTQEDIRSHPETVFLLNKYEKTSKGAARDIASALTMLFHYENSSEAIQNRIHQAYVMANHMDADVEDVVAVLLCKLCKEGKTHISAFNSAFSDSRAERYYNRAREAVKEYLKNTGWLVEAKQREPKHTWDIQACIDFYIMQRVCDKMFVNLIRAVNKRGVSDTTVLYEAYDLAKEAHAWVHRSTGEPYLSHPLHVAQLLDEVGAESYVLAAALLHDVVEDTKYELDKIREQFGYKVAKLVDAVTSVDKEFAKSRIMEQYQADKAEMDEQTFEKLKKMVKNDPAMILALYIKAADRIHNLRTIDSMQSFKKFEKADLTETDYLPLFREYGLNCFVSIIEDLVWKIGNIELYKKIERIYSKMLQYCQPDIETAENLVNGCLNKELRTVCRQSYVAEYNYEIIQKTYSPYEICKWIHSKIQEPNSIERYIDKSIMPVCDLIVVLDPLGEDRSMRLFSSLFIGLFMECFSQKGATITNFENDTFNRLILFVEDSHRNTLRFCFVMRDDYIMYRTGGVFGFSQGQDSETGSDQAPKQKICVRLRNGDPVELPEGSTVIDLAFAIHEAIGLSAKSATINGQPATVYTILHDSNQVVIDADTAEKDGEMTKFIPHARIDWLAYAVTSNAKKKLTRYLERKYEEGDNPRYESKSKVSATVFDTVFNELIAQPVLANLVKEDNHEQA